MVTLSARRRCMCALALGALAAAAPALAQPAYRIELINKSPLELGAVYPTAMSDEYIAGYGSTLSGLQVFRYEIRTKTFEWIGNPPGYPVNAVPASVNHWGQMVVNARKTIADLNRAFRWERGGYTKVLGDTISARGQTPRVIEDNASMITDAGHIIGTASLSGMGSWAYVKEGAILLDRLHLVDRLEPPPTGRMEGAIGGNQTGTAAGRFVCDSCGHVGWWALYDYLDATWHDLADRFWYWDMNGDTVLVTDSQNPDQSFLYRSGRTVPIGPPKGTGLAINVWEEVVGLYPDPATGAAIPWLYSMGRTWDLHGLINGEIPWNNGARLGTPVEINPWGEIVTSNGYLLVPDQPAVGAKVERLYPVSGARTGQTVTLWTYVRNTGRSPLPAGSTVGLTVLFDSFGREVGRVPVAGLGSGDAIWVSVDWAIPATWSTEHNFYSADVWAGDVKIASAPRLEHFVVTRVPQTAAAVHAVSSEPATTTPGGSIKLWARVTNTGVAALPADATVWFYVDGPSWTGSHWIGSVPAGGLASGAERWYDLNWGVPADRSPGNYRVSAQVWAPGLGAVSPWSPAHDFAVSVPLPPRARVLSVYPVPEREPGQVAVFWALVRNDGNVRFPAGSAVWFYVAGPGVTNNWAASKDVSGLEPGQTRWYDVEWVPQNSGQFTYWAQVWRSGAGAISPWSAGQRFNACFVCVF